MDPTLVIVVVVVVLLVAVAAAFGIRKGMGTRNERRQLRERFGPEYERTVRERGSEKAATAELAERERSHEELELVQLSEADQQWARGEMARLQFRYLEDPGGVLGALDRLVEDMLHLRGYPAQEDVGRALRLFSVAHPRAAQSLRKLHDNDYGPSDTMRSVFLEVRDALRDTIGVTYGLRDLEPERQRPSAGGERGTGDERVPQVPAGPPENGETQANEELAGRDQPQADETWADSQPPVGQEMSQESRERSGELDGPTESTPEAAEQPTDDTAEQPAGDTVEQPSEPSTEQARDAGDSASRDSPADTGSGGSERRSGSQR
jgi:hypothetical protein